jgi:hypothetical protein
MRELRLAAAREHRHGLQIMTFEQLAARLAGGMTRPVDDETLRSVVQQALHETDIGELDRLKLLPGMVGAAVDTLQKAWRAGIDLQARAPDSAGFNRPAGARGPRSSATGHDAPDRYCDRGIAPA